MPLYVGDYLADTAHFSTIEHGAYLLLIMHYWRNGGLPNDDEALRQIARLSRHQWQKAFSKIFSKFEPGWKHKRIEAELAKCLKLSEVNSANAKRRHSERTKFAGVSQTHSHSPREDAATPPSDEAELYARGKAVLGNNSGGLIARLLKSKKGSIALARAAIEQASTKQDPREYIGAVIRGPAHERHGLNDPLAGII